MASAASSQYMLEVHMSTIYHKVGNSLPQPNTKISHRIKIIMAPNKTIRPLHIYLETFEKRANMHNRRKQNLSSNIGSGTTKF